MSIVTNTQTTFTAKGLRENLSDVIYNISPEDTPGMSNFGRENVNGTLFEWQTDSLAAADTTNAQLQGDDITSFPAAATTVRVGNNTQISRKLIIVAGTLEAVSKAGRKSEKAYQTAKRSAELKRDMEAIIFFPQGGSSGSVSVAPTTATLGAWIKTNTVKGAGGADPAYVSGVPGSARTDGTQATFTETMVKTVAQNIYTQGGQLKILMMGPSHKATAATFTGIASNQYQINGPKAVAIIGAADVYVSNFGVLRLIPNRFQRERDAWFLDPQYVSVAYLRPFAVKPLATTGDAEKSMLIVEWGLKVKQEAALGLAADLS